MALANVNVRFGVDLKQFSTAMQNASRKMDRFGKKMKRTGQSMTMNLTAPIAGLAAVSFNTFQKFELQMAKVQAVSGATADEFKRLSQNAKELGASTIFSASQVAELQLEFAKLGFTAPQIERVTGATLALAQATGSDLSRSAAVAGSTLRAFEMDASQTGRVTDVMAKSFSSSALDMESFSEAMKYVAPVAAAAGISLEETTAMLGALANNGIKGSQAGTALRRIISDIGATGKPVSQAISDLANRGLDLGMAMDEVGRNAQTALLVLGKNRNITAGLTKEYEQSQGAAKSMAETMDQTSSGGLAAMRSALEGLAISMGEIISEVVTPMVRWIAKFATYLNKLPRPIKIVIAVLAALAAAIGPVLIAIGLMSTGMAALSTASLPLTATILAIVAVLAALAAGAAYVYENAEAFRDRFLIVWAKIKNAVVDAVINILKAHDKLFSVLGMDMFGRAAKGLERFKSEIPDEKDAKPFKSFGETMSNVADEVFGTFEKVKEQAVETTTSVANAVKKTGDSLQRFAKPIENLANRGFKNVMGELKTPKFYGPTPEQIKSTETMLDLYDREQRMINNIETAVAGLGGAFEQMFTTLIDGGENAFGAVVRYLKQLVIRLIAAAAAAALLSTLLGGLGMAQFSFQSLFKQFSGFDIAGKRAMGGPVIGNLPYLVGERGPELFVPGTSGSIVSNNRMKSLGSENMVVSGEFILSDTTLMAAVERGSQRVLRTNPGLKF